MANDTNLNQDEAKQEILNALDQLKKDSFLDDLRHRSLSDIVRAVGKELEELDSFFQESIMKAALPLKDANLLRSGRATIIRSAAAVCRHLNDFEAAMAKNEGKEQDTLKKAFDWIVSGLMSELEKFAKAMQFDGWSLSVSAGLPAGVSFTVTFSFK